MATGWKASAFECDVTPPIGHPLCAGWYPSASAIRDTLRARGLILAGPDESPMILCALDWAELSNGDHLRWREALASAIGTAPERVTVHCTHAHDTPWSDRDAQNLLDAYGGTDIIQADDWAERVREQVAQAVAQAWERPVPCTHISTGQARVDRVASNRRVMGDDGRVRGIRWTLTRDPEIRAALILTYQRRRDIPIPIAALRLNADTIILHLPSEAFITYQLFAQQLRQESFVAVAAYGDCGPGYITHAGASEEGGYEPVDSFVSERSEQILRDAITRTLA